MRQTEKHSNHSYESRASSSSPSDPETVQLWCYYKKYFPHHIQPIF